jgi:DNA repair exonuclease SbcCD ATPase subunit
MSSITTGEKFFRGLSDCVQFFKDRESELLAEVNFYAERVESKDEEIDKLKNVVAEKNCEIYRLSERSSLNGRSAEVEELKKTVEELNAVVAENKETLDEKNAELIAKEALVDQLKKRIAELQVAEDYQDVIIAKKDEQIGKLKKNIEFQNGVVESQNEDLSQMQDELYVKDKQLDERDAKIRELREIVEEKEREVKRKTKLAEDFQKLLERDCSQMSPFVPVPLCLWKTALPSPVSAYDLQLYHTNFLINVRPRLKIEFIH